MGDGSISGQTLGQGRRYRFLFWLQLMGTRLPLVAEAEIQSFAPASRCCLRKVGQGQDLSERFMTFCRVNTFRTHKLYLHMALQPRAPGPPATLSPRIRAALNFCVSYFWVLLTQ